MISILSNSFFASWLYATSPVLEFVINIFNERPFPLQYFVIQVHERVLRVLL